MDNKTQKEVFAFIDRLTAEGYELHEILSAISQVALTRENIPTGKRKEISEALQQAAEDIKRQDVNAHSPKD